MNRSCVLMLVLIFAVNQAYADELKDFLVRRSGEIYNEARGGDAGIWKKPLETALRRFRNAGQISESAGFTGFYGVSREEVYIARMLPGGQLVVSGAALAILEGSLAETFPSVQKKGRIKDIAAYRERIAAALVAQELAHHAGNHALMSARKLRKADVTVKKFRLDMARYEPEQVFQADVAAALSLRSAGYASQDMIDYLDLLNAIFQETKKGKHAVFADSLGIHIENPTPRERLQRLDNGSREFHEMLAGLERAFDDIRLGGTEAFLSKAIRNVAAAIEKFPGNTYLFKARAVGLHKLWIASIEKTREQELKPIIGLPRFRDDMVKSEKAGTRGASGVPGNPRLWYSAKIAYDAVFGITGLDLDPDFLSSFAAFLVYHEDHIDEAKTNANKAYGLRKNATTTNNLAMVSFIFGEGKNSREDMDRAERLLAGQVRMVRQRGIEGAYTDATPVLNYALLLSYAGKKDEAKKAAAEYFRTYDRKSEWAKYLMEQSGAPMPEPRKNLHAVKGIRIGDTLEKAKQVLGKPAGESGSFYSYTDRGVILVVDDGACVAEIRLRGSGAPRVDDSFGTGMTRADIEKILGGPSHKSNDAEYQYKEGLVVVRYLGDSAEEIVLQQ